MKDRGMMKWLPYKSLNEQGDFLNAMLYKKKLVEKPILSSEAAEELNRRLLSYKGGKADYSYYEDGIIYEVEGETVKLNFDYKTLLTEKGDYVPLADLLSFEEEGTSLFGDGDEGLPAD